MFLTPHARFGIISAVGKANLRQAYSRRIRTVRISTRNAIIVHRVCGYALTNAAGRGVSIAIAYDGSYPSNMSYALKDGGVFSVKLTRKQSRRELVTRRDYAFDGLPVYFYAADYDLLNRPTNATDSVSVAREWLYNRRSELAAAAVGTNFYGYAYDTIGNRLWSAANVATNEYAANSLNQYTSVLRASESYARSLAKCCSVISRYSVFLRFGLQRGPQNLFSNLNLI